MRVWGEEPGPLLKLLHF